MEDVLGNSAIAKPEALKKFKMAAVAILLSLIGPIAPISDNQHGNTGHGSGSRAVLNSTRSVSTAVNTGEKIAETVITAVDTAVITVCAIFSPVFTAVDPDRVEFNTARDPEPCPVLPC
jgi:hypothetical protein